MSARPGTEAITFLDLTTGTLRTGQFWSEAPLATGRVAMWLVAHDSGRPVHVHKVNARNLDTRQALRKYADVPEWITGVTSRVFQSIRLDLTESAS
jgi:hypothetical protein